MPESNKKFELATSYYAKFRPEMGEPVQISNGRPKYKTPYDLRFMLSSMFPDWGWMKLPVAEFRRRYWERLDSIGLEQIKRDFEKVVEASGQTTLVLLCFEKHPKDCHRGDFAMWWERVTGEKIPELS